ncbi:Asparagine synthetase [Magnetospirillum sp. UT-4]|nr:Asparagine synthetase [Magnetospirillum sp. UT-4]
MCRRLSHRGPDDSGIFIDDGIALGNNRLSIIDSAAGHQPMEIDGHVIVYNGELYNHGELRHQLMALGRSFRTHCDTETVLQAFMHWGTDCLPRLNGMFAFAIWDRASRQLVLARDRVGIKPLYLAQSGAGFAFASEAKALLPAVGRPEVDWTSIHGYLTFGYIPPLASPFAGITKAPPGHFAVWRANDGARPLHWQRYWRPSFGQGPRERVADVMAETERRIETAVERELMSDVPLGLFLSGGLDSAAIACYATRRGADLQSFSVGFRERSHDESDAARRIASHFGLRHRVLEMTPDLLREGVSGWIGAMDEPFADSTAVPLLLLSRFARQHIKVALTGWGGDEVFAGYPTLRAHQVAGWFRRLPLTIRRDLASRLVAMLPQSDAYLSLRFKASRFLRGPTLRPEEQHFLWMGYFDDCAKARLLRPDILEKVAADTFEPVHAAEDGLSERTLPDRIMALDMDFFLAGNGLFQCDRMTMAASLEARVPLLNQDVLDYVLPLPIDMKMLGGHPKGLLRRILAPHLPADILRRPKKGFAPPSGAFLRGPLKDVLDEVLSRERVEERGLFHYGEVARLKHEHLSRKADHGRELWALFSLAAWYDRHVLNETPVETKMSA